MSKSTLDKKQAVEAVKLWSKSKGIKLTSEPTHIYPRAYVIAKIRNSELIVAAPWMDAEPQCVTDAKANPVIKTGDFDEGLKPGDWCILAYITYQNIGTIVAIPVYY